MLRKANVEKIFCCTLIFPLTGAFANQGLGVNAILGKRVMVLTDTSNQFEPKQARDKKMTALHRCKLNNAVTLMMWQLILNIFTTSY
jgi:hypothetical protein